MPIQAGIESIDDNAMDVLFGAKTPGANNIAGPQGETEIETGAEDAKKALPNTPTKKVLNEEPAEDLLATKSADEVADDLFGKEEEEEEEIDDKKLPVKPKAVVKKPASTESQEVDYKAYYDMMVEANVWGEVEVPEGTEWNIELIKEIQALQVSSKYEDLLDKKGPYGKAIVQYEDNGGNPGDLLELFREQRTVKNFDISTAEGQEEFLTSYFESQNYSAKSIERSIKALTEQGGDVLKEEAEEKKALWDLDYKAEIEAKQKEQALYAKQVEEQARNFNKVMNDTILADSTITPKERKELAGYVLDYSHKYNNQMVNQFYVDASEIQKDPEAYLELAKFMKGLKDGSYKKKIADTSKKEANVKTFMKIKGSSALTRRDGSQPELNGSDNETSFITYLTGKNK